MDKETDFFGGVLKIGLGLFLGSLLIWMALQYYARYQISQLNQVVQVSLQDVQRDDVTERARQRREELQRERQSAAAQQVVLERQQAALIAERRKDAAWSAFFQPSPECLRTASIECGNAHMRARREFERRYTAGEL